MQIMLPENCWPINSLDWKWSAWIWVDVGNLKFHPITKLSDITSILLELLVHLGAYYVGITSIMKIKFPEWKCSPSILKNIDAYLVGVSSGVQYTTVIYVYFFIKCVVSWSENSVRFENLIWELASGRAKFCEILSCSVRYGMYDGHVVCRHLLG